MKIQFIGTGSAFNFKAGNTSALINDHILIDCGATVPAKLSEMGLLEKVDMIAITHCHGDHCHGLEAMGFLNFFKYQRRVKLICPEEIKLMLWKILEPSMSNLNTPFGAPFKATLDTYFDWLEPTLRIRYGVSDLVFPKVDDIEFSAINVPHVEGMPSVMYSLTQIDTIYYTGDTKIPLYDLIQGYHAANDGILRGIFHDCQLFNGGAGGVHPFFNDLEEKMPKALEGKVWLMHYGEGVEWLTKENLKKFGGYVIPGQTFNF